MMVRYPMGSLCSNLDVMHPCSSQGRAGRPQFDTSGTAVIMTHSSTQARSHVKVMHLCVVSPPPLLQGLYRTVTSGTLPIESTLGSSLVEHVVSEITLRTVTSIQTGLDLLRSTFLNIRMRRLACYDFSQRIKHVTLPCCVFSPTIPATQCTIAFLAAWHATWMCISNEC